jgi:PAS domain S-box-containing protein
MGLLDAGETTWNNHSLKMNSKTLEAPYLKFLLFVIAYGIGYHYANSFSQTVASPCWFPDSVLLCALLYSSPRNWWLLVSVTFPIRLLLSDNSAIAPWFVITTTLIDAAKGLITAAALRRFNKNVFRFESLKELGSFLLFAVFLIPAVSAFAGAGARFLLGYKFWGTWLQWFLGDATTHLIITPALLYWIIHPPWKNPFPSKKRFIEAIILMVGLIFAGYISFHFESTAIGIAEPLFFAPIPFLFWAALRFGMLGASGAILIMAIIAVQAVLNAQGPFARESIHGTALALQNFLIIRAAPLYVVASLIEQRKSTENSLRESEQRFRNVANIAPVLIWMTDPHRFFNFFNQVWLDFTGRTLEKEIGNRWIENIHQEDLQHWSEVFLSSFDKRIPFELEYRLRSHDGEYRWILDKGVPRYDPNGQFLGFIGSAVDITERKRIDEMNRTLFHAQRLTILGEFTAMIAHEVNQPLSAIMNNTEAVLNLLKRPNPPMDHIKEIMDDIRKDDVRASETIRRIRTLLKKREMHMEALDLNQITSEVLGIVDADALRRHVQIRKDFKQDLPLAFGDPAYLQHVLLNLISNGIDAMRDKSDGRRILMVQTKQDRNDAIEVCVTDSGCGIPSDKLPQIFNSFFTTKDDGMGLGLAIASSIIEAHRGRIWVENNVNGGTTFHFTVRPFTGEK